MKKTSYFLLITIISILGMGSCKKSGDFLDPKVSNDLTADKVFTDSTNTLMFLNRAYYDVGFTFYLDSYQGLTRLVGGSHVVLGNEGSPQRYNGAQNPATLMALGNLTPEYLAPATENWNVPYADIRRCNLLISSISQTPVSTSTRQYWVAQARFLRAWYYFLLLRTYGGVPLVGDKVFELEDKINLPRNTFQECVDYIATEMDAVAAVLPSVTTQLPADYGRATKGAAMAVKARLYLYAASPLFNGGSISTDPQLAALTAYPTYDKERWNRAHKAIQDVMNLGTYSLYLDNTTRAGYGYYKVFQMRYNSEYILGKMEAKNTTMENWLRTPSLGDGYRVVPHHRMAMAYFMKNGLPITDPASGFDPKNPYLNREPRFYNSIIYNGADWYNGSNSKVKINTYIGSGSADAVSQTGGVHTGYYIRKMLNEDGTGQTERCFPLIRYAEILLSFAEAKNEYSGPSSDIYDALKQIRNRAGIDPGTNGLYGLKANMTQDEMRKLIYEERRIELAFEEHRMWDVRRWKTADVELNYPSEAIFITKNPDGSFTYTPMVRYKWLFDKRFYLFPITSQEIGRNTGLVQNPGW